MKRSLSIVIGFLLIVSWIGSKRVQGSQPYPNRPIHHHPRHRRFDRRHCGKDRGGRSGENPWPAGHPRSQTRWRIHPGHGFGGEEEEEDGYTLTYTNSAAIVYSRILSPETVPYDPDKDLELPGISPLHRKRPGCAGKRSMERFQGNRGLSPKRTQIKFALVPPA